jgi:quercetin dioxygenase-like cupin family protein
MPNATIAPEEMLKRVARFGDLTPSRRPLIDAVLPQYQREIFSIIGGGVLEDPLNKPPITAVEGFHLSIVNAGPGMGTGLHDHKTVEVFMPLTGNWTVMWGDEGENQLTLGQYDVISVPINVMRGFRNDSDHEALLLAIVGGTDPGRVEWIDTVMSAVREKGFDLDHAGKIIELAKP